MRKFLLAAACLALTTGAAQADGHVHTGTTTQTLAHFYALAPNASPIPSKDAACAEKFADFKGQQVEVQYEVNTETNMMAATSTVMGTTVPMFTLGLSNSYSFMATEIPTALADKGVMRVLYSMDKSFGNAESQLMTTLDAEVNCAITSTPLVSAK